MAQQPTYDFPLTAMLSALGMELPGLVILGLILLTVSLVLAFAVPSPTRFQEMIFRGLFGLAAASIASEIPGILDINSKVVSASGALAVFVLIYLFNPPKLIQEIKSKPPPATKAKETVTQTDKVPRLPSGDTIPPVSPLPQGSRMPHASNPLFVGRENELRELARKLTPGSGATVGVHAAIIGTPGVGKTQLAIEYVHRYSQFYHGVFWLDMETSENAQSEVARCGGPEGMALQDFDKKSLPDQAATAQATWKDGQVWLLVFDNVQDPDVVKQWRPKMGRCSVLLTSRRSEWPPELGIAPFPVETLPREKSLELLAKARPAITTDPAQRQSADEICDRLGDLALALSVAATYLRKYKSESLSQYLQALRK